MHPTQFVKQPHGVTVHGSAIIRVDPDSAIFSFTVREVGRSATESFDKVKQRIVSLKTLCQRLGGVVKVSPPLLEKQIAGKSLGKKPELVGRQDVLIELRSLQHFEILQIALADNGYGNFRVQMKNNRLREARVDARQSAVLAASKKAELFAEAAGVKIGRILHIEEIERDPQLDASELEEFPGVIPPSPGCIEIISSVVVSFSIKGGGTPEVTGEFHFL